ncbi:MAG: hypothetical protein IJX40_00760 [Alistipes sp.]|nr:hypothetical protein [Alistipes sp.]
MLVAVAAMAFTACQKDNDETNKTEQKTVITGVATIANDDTRSGFLPKEDGATSYKSAWEGGETIKIFYNDKVATATIDANGVFTAKLEGEVSSITVCSPASAWNDEGEYYVTDWQTSGDNSVDPSVHILKSEATAIVDGAASVNMAHAVAYGKMTIGVPQDFATYRVAVTINNEASYSVYGGKNGTYWFATKPFAEVETITVAAYNVNGQRVEKTVSMEDVAKPLAFHAGRVSTFSVSGLAEKIEQVEFTDAEAIIVGDKLNVTFSNDDHTLLVPFFSNTFENGVLKTGKWVLGDNFSSYDITFNSISAQGYYCTAMEVTVTDTNVTINFTWNGDKYSAVYNGTIAADLDALPTWYFYCLMDLTDRQYSWEHFDNYMKWGTIDELNITNGIQIALRNDNWDWVIFTFPTNGNKYITPGTYTVGSTLGSESYNATNRELLTSGTVEVSYDEATGYTITFDVYQGSTSIKGKFVGDLSAKGITAPGTGGNTGGSEEPDPENPGEGGDATESFENWVFSASLDQGARLITVTDGTHTVTFTINAIAGGTFKIGGYGALYAYSVTVNGEPAESASGTIQMDSATGYKIRLDAEINGVKYTGTSTNAVVK